jgi:hypothetical protein
MPIDIMWGMPEESRESTRPVEELVEKMRDDMESAYELARKQLQVAAERRKTTYDIRVKKCEFTEGDWVWYYYPRRYQSRSPKWQQLYTGPYLLVRAIPPVNFVLQKSAKAKPFVVHVDKLKKCYGATPRSWLRSNTESAVADIPGETTAPQQETVDLPVERKRRKQLQHPVRGYEAAQSVDEQEEKSDSGAAVGRPQRVNRRSPAYLRDYGI